MSDQILHAILNSVIFSIIGVVVFGLAFIAISKALPYNIHKEIEEDQNTSLGILLGSVIIGLSIIISAAIKG